MDQVVIGKVLASMAYPTGLVAMLVFWSLVSGLFGRRAMLAQILAAIIAFTSTNPTFARWLAATLEDQYPQRDIAQIAQHDAIVVLGGGLRLPVPPARAAQLSAGSDRYWHATQLYLAGKADKVFLTGGNVFEQRSDRGQPLAGEAVYAADIMHAWGVPREAIVIESLSRNTVQNKLNTLALLQQENVKSALLVTSAIHMPRSMQQFSDLPIEITAATADVLVRTTEQPVVLNWLPSAGALKLTTQAVHEYYGMAVLAFSRFIAQVG